MAPSYLATHDGGAGPGLPVAFLHIAGGSASQWSAQLEHVRARRRAVAFDLPGHGQSGGLPDGDYTFERLGEHLAEALAELGLDEILLVGHANAGSIALACAALRPGVVRGLLLVDPAGDARRLPAAPQAAFLARLGSDEYHVAIEERFRQQLARSTPEVRERVLRDLRATRKEAVLGIFHALMRFDPLSALDRYGGPVQLVASDVGESLPYSLQRLRPDIPRVIVPGAGHWVQLDRPDVVNAALDAFLASLESDATGTAG